MRTVRNGALLGALLAICHVAGAEEKAAIRLAFNIQPQPLGEALTVFSHQSGLQVLHRDNAQPVAEITLPGVRGNGTALSRSVPRS
jgi:hypothetical protein